MLFVYLLIIVNIVLFVMSYTGKLDTSDYSLSYYDVSVRKQYYRLVTSSFMHGSVLHLLMNMIALYNIGSILVYVIGTVRFILAFFISSIVGHILTILMRHNNNDDYSSSIGASGGICGLIGVYLVILFIVSRGGSFNSILRSLLSIAIISIIPGVDGKSHINCLAIGIVLGFVICLL